MQNSEVEDTIQDDEAVSKDSYAKRVDAIIDTKYRQDTTNWLAEEVVEGDAPVRLYEQYNDELRKQAEEDAKEDHQAVQESTVGNLDETSNEESI